MSTIHLAGSISHLPRHMEFNRTAHTRSGMSCMTQTCRSADMPRTVADQLADVLVAAGVRRIYGTAGDSMIWLAHAIQRQGKLQWVPMQNAEVAAFAATT